MDPEKNKGEASASPTLIQTNETLQTELVKSKAENKALKDELVDAATMIDDLKDQLKSGGEAKGPIGKVGKQKFRIVGGFKKGGKTYTPADIAADAQILKSLVDGKSTLVELITS